MMEQLSSTVSPLPVAIEYVVAPLGTVPEAPADATPYVRYDEQWRDGNVYFDAQGSAVAVQANLTAHTELSDIHFADVASDAKAYDRKDRAWVENTISSNWEADVTLGDLKPTKADAGLGSLQDSPSFVAVGKVGTVNSVEGILVQNADASGGGIALIGYRDDPSNARNGIVNADSPVQIIGTVVALDGNVGVIAPNPINEDHYLILRPTVALSDGRLFSAMELGPRVAYANEESNTSALDYALVDLVEQQVVSLTLANAYTADLAAASLRVALEETGGRTATFAVRVYVNDGLVSTSTVNLTSNSLIFQDTGISQITLSPGDVVDLRVMATESHPNAIAWVRGLTIVESRIAIQGE